LRHPTDPMQDIPQKQYDCMHCKKAFRGADGVARIRCPHCRQTNIVLIPVLAANVRPAVPKFTLAEAREAVQALLDEPTTDEGWEPVQGATNYEGVESCYSRPFCVNENYDEIWLSKATSHEVTCTLQQIIDVFWDIDQELKVWNNSTLKAAQVLERNASNTEQLVYQERKVHASISMGGDVVIRRAYEAYENDYFFSWATSVDSTVKPPQRNLRRCFLLISGFFVKALSPSSCVISSCASYYETGNIPTVAITEECKRVALRICRIVKRIQDVVRISGLAPPSAAAFTPAYSMSSQPAPQQQVTRQASASSAPSGGGKKCLSCNVAVAGNFCPTCGSKTVAAASGCSSCGAPDSGGKFCPSCGSPK